MNAVANTSPSLGLVPAEEPKSLNYSGETSRLLSFRRWPRNSNQTADDLVRAGFYYTGIADSVKCFSCNGSLRHWVIGDEPWTEHARWFPRCNYVRTVKGEAFIRSVQATHSGQTNALMAPNSTASITQSASAGARTFPIEARAIRARMDTTRVRSVLDMGFTRDLVYKVIEHRLTTTGDDFPNVQSLLEAVFDAEEALPGSSSSRTRKTTSIMSRAFEPAAATTAGGNGGGTTATVATATGGNGESTATRGNSTATAAATAPTGENQASATVNSSSKGKIHKRKKKNKSATRSNGTSGTKTAVSGTEPSLSHDTATTTDDQRLQCKICMDDEAKILFLPCGHLCSCAKCAPALRNCAICRALIRGTVRVYLS